MQPVHKERLKTRNMKPCFLPAALLLLAISLSTSLEAQEFFDSGGIVEKMSFDEKLRNIRSIVIEGDERATTARSHEKIDKALQGFLETEFMVRFKDIKLEAEILAATFKAHSPKLAPEDVARVKRGYSQVADEFNLLLLDIKKDFMDGKTMKLIKSHPDMYSNSLQYKLRELKDDYSQHFERTVAEVIGSDTYSAIPLAAIFGLIKLAVDVTNYIAMANFESRRVKEEHLNTFFIEPYSFRAWEDIEISEGDIYNQAMQTMDEEHPQVNRDTMPDDLTDPFIRDGQDVNSAKPKKKKN